MHSSLECSRVVRHPVVTRKIAGSIPAAPASFQLTPGLCGEEDQGRSESAQVTPDLAEAVSSDQSVAGGIAPCHGVGTGSNPVGRSRIYEHVKAIQAIPDCQKETVIGGRKYKCRNMCQQVDDLYCLMHAENAARFDVALTTKESELEIKPRPITKEEREAFFHTFDANGWGLPTERQQFNARLCRGFKWLMG